MCINFLNYAKCCYGEMRAQICIGIEIDYTPKESGKKWLEETMAISSMTGRLIKSKKNYLTNNSKK